MNNHNVGLHRRTGLWSGRFVYRGKRVSAGYYRDRADAARAVDYYRHRLGLPAINFPDDLDATIARRAEWEHRTVRGPRGVGAAIAAAITGRKLSIDEVLDEVAALGTTRGTVQTALDRLVREGKARRIERGVYTTDTEDH